MFRNSEFGDDLSLRYIGEPPQELFQNAVLARWDFSGPKPTAYRVKYVEGYWLEILEIERLG